MVTTSLMNILNFNENWNFLDFFWNFEILWKFWIFLKFLKFWNFLKYSEFWNFLKNSEFSLIDDEIRVFRINIKLLSNSVAELKVRENDSHCRSIVLKTMDRSIVKQLEKEKNSNFNVENFVVMFIYWGTIMKLISCTGYLIKVKKLFSYQYCKCDAANVDIVHIEVSLV
jgi:hypothetical protein